MAQVVVAREPHARTLGQAGPPPGPPQHPESSGCRAEAETPRALQPRREADDGHLPEDGWGRKVLWMPVALGRGDVRSGPHL